MPRIYTRILLIFLGLQFVVGNVEKVIFLGPESLQVPTTHPTLENLDIQALSPEQSTLRTELRAEFPTSLAPKGESSWVLLEALTEGQRYEVRICWAATQPTSFGMITYELPEVFQSPELIASLAKYSLAQQFQAEHIIGRTPSMSKGFTKGYGSNTLQSVLFLQILAAADYYTTNRTLMEHVPPVLVDIILDPFVLNIFPRSLLPTAGYLLTVTVCSWYVAKFITSWLHMVARTDSQKKDI